MIFSPKTPVLLLSCEVIVYLRVGNCVPLYLGEQIYCAFSFCLSVCLSISLSPLEEAWIHWFEGFHMTCGFLI